MFNICWHYQLVMTSTNIVETYWDYIYRYGDQTWLDQYSPYRMHLF